MFSAGNIRIRSLGCSRTLQNCSGTYESNPPPPTTSTKNKKQRNSSREVFLRQKCMQVDLFPVEDVGNSETSDVFKHFFWIPTVQ